MNFSISFAIYTAAAFVLIILLIGIVLVPIVLGVWFVLMIVMSVYHIQNDTFEPPLTIEFIKKI